MSKVNGHGLFTPEEKCLFRVLSAALWTGATDKTTDETRSVALRVDDAPDKDRLLTMAQEHAVLSLLYPLLEGEEQIPDPLAACIRNESIRTVQQNYRLMFLSHYLAEQMEKRGAAVAVIKGVIASDGYPVPELRKSGDVDLLLFGGKALEEAERVMEETGFKKDGQQHSAHHHTWRTPEGIDIELHVMLAEPFDDREVNAVLERQMDRMSSRVCRKSVMGLEFPVLADGDHAYYLLIHMLHHFLRAGFGLKLLCDWTVFWNLPRQEDEVRRYIEQVKETGLTGFSEMVTCLCTHYLGLKKEHVRLFFAGCYSRREYGGFMREILDAGEFGMQEESRMVVIRHGGIGGYMREFHHQMCLNYPEKSKIPLLWPALWIAALGRFLINNRKRRGVSAIRILRKAGERGRQVEKLDLFKKD